MNLLKIKLDFFCMKKRHREALEFRRRAGRLVFQPVYLRFQPSADDGEGSFDVCRSSIPEPRPENPENSALSRLAPRQWREVEGEASEAFAATNIFQGDF